MSAPLPWAQRLGYLLERVDAGETTSELQHYVRQRAHEYTPLLPGANTDNAVRVPGWKLLANADVEPDT